jgi:mRNA interferase MazF
MAVTSQSPTSLSIGEALIQGWQQAGLLKPSLIKPVLTTIDPTLVVKKVGRLTPADQVVLK